MKFLVIGLIGILVSALVSMRFYMRASRLNHDRPFGGAVPAYVSIAFLISLGYVVYGIYALIISK